MSPRIPEDACKRSEGSSYTSELGISLGEVSVFLCGSHSGLRGIFF